MGQSTPSNTASADHDAKLAHLYAEGDSLIARIRAENKARLFIISGPSGVGKDSVIDELRRVFPQAEYVVTSTTRPIRPNETDGIHYYFLTKEAFETGIAQGEFIEHATVYDNHYGVPRTPIANALAAGKDVIIKVDVQGAETLRERIANTTSIFLCPESMPALRKRLQDRKTETDDVLHKRFRTANEELKEVRNFDYIVFNEDGHLDRAINEIVNIIAIEHNKVHQPAVILP